MAETIEKITRTDPPQEKGKDPVDPDVQIAKLRFWARLLISLMAFCLFGFLVITMINKPDELAQSSKDLINLAFGAFLPIIGMLGKFWFEASPEPLKPKNEGPTQFEQRVDITAPNQEKET